MKQHIREFSIILLAASLAGGLGAASDNRDRQSRPTSDEQRRHQRADESPPKLTDDNIRSAVESRLKTLDGIDTSKLQVETRDRAVTVTGTVDSLIETDRIMEAVSAVRGVEGVITNFTVEAEPRSDTEVRADVMAALEFDPATSDHKIDVAVDNGEVRLSGKAETSAAKQLAGWIAANVRGVSRIRNDLTVALQKRSDAEIKTAVEKRFRSDPLVSDGILVGVQNGRVQLSGEVSSAIEKQWAIADARSLNVEHIDASQLRVNPESRNSVSHSEANLSDTDIAESIRHAYVNDPRVFSFNPDVRVKDRNVTLSGTVDNLKAKQAAAQIAQNTAGVKQVKNNLAIRGLALSDRHIAQNLRDALERSTLVDPEDIIVKVDGGRATLTGDVDSNFEKWAAGDVAATTRGITEVQNQLVPYDLPELNVARHYYYPWHSSYYPWISSGNGDKKADRELHADVRDQLTWSAFTDAEDISISVEDGVVTLTGQVDSRMEKGAAEDNAYQAGAARVKNQLVVLEPTGR